MQEDVIDELVNFSYVESMPSFLDDDYRFKKIISRLSNQEERILKTILVICLKKRSLKTGSMISEDFDIHLKMNRNSRETALKRLCKKGIIKRFSGKRGVKGCLNLGFVNPIAMRVAEEVYYSNQVDDKKIK